jgi:hypothetical protein
MAESLQQPDFPQKELFLSKLNKNVLFNTEQDLDAFIKQREIGGKGGMWLFENHHSESFLFKVKFVKIDANKFL